MSEYDIETRLFGKEDIDFDTEGTGAQTEYTDLDGNSHPVTKLNASHLPLTQSARVAAEGATNVDDAVNTLSKEIRDVAGQRGAGMIEDRTIVLESASTRQAQINEPFRNLGGHTLTFKFPEEGDVQVAIAPLEFQGFYNGVLVIDLNGCDIHDNGTFSPEGVLRIKNCHCHVRIIGDGRSSAGYGKIIFTDNHYGIAIIESPSCSVEHMSFESSSTADDFALYTESGNAFFASCTFTGCGQTLIKSIYRDYVDAHKVDASAHASLFAAKAEVSHTHTLDDITNFSSGVLNSALWADVAGALVSGATVGYATNAGTAGVATALISGSTVGYAAEAGVASALISGATVGYAQEAGALVSGATVGYAAEAGALVSGATVGYAQSAGYAERLDSEFVVDSAAYADSAGSATIAGAINYDGPFAVKTGNAENEFDINAGVVVVGSARYPVPASAATISNGYDLYLKGTYNNGSPTWSMVVTSGTIGNQTSGTFMTKLAHNEGGVAKQSQFGEITTVPWGISGGGGGTSSIFNTPVYHDDKLIALPVSSGAITVQEVFGHKYMFEDQTNTQWIYGQVYVDSSYASNYPDVEDTATIQIYPIGSSSAFGDGHTWELIKYFSFSVDSNCYPYRATFSFPVPPGYYFKVCALDENEDLFKWEFNISDDAYGIDE